MRKVWSFLLCAVIVLTMAGCQETFDSKKDVKTDHPVNGAEISAWVKKKADHSGMDLQDIYACSVDKIVIADSVGVLIYDRKEQKIKYAVNLMGTRCQYFDSYSIRTQVKMSQNGKDLIVYNQRNDTENFVIEGPVYHYKLEEESSKKEPVLLKYSETIKEKDELFQKIQKENKNCQKDTFDQFHDKKQMKTFWKKERDGMASYSEHAFVWKDSQGKENLSFFAKQDKTYYLYTKQKKDGKIISEKVNWQIPDETKIENQLPEYLYHGKDQRIKAVYEKIKELHTDEETREQGGVCIPVPKIYKIEEKQDDVKVYGSFWYENWTRHGNILVQTGEAGDEPGVMHLKKEEGKYIVTKIETSEDGSEMAPSIRKICKGHPLIAEKMIKEDFPESIKKKNVKKYVELNHLDINYYQNYGWDLQRIY